MRKILLLILGLLVIPLHCILAQAPKIIGYQYWFDDNDAGMISQSGSPASTLDLNTSVTVPTLPVGFHRFNIRFKDDSLQYSPVSSSVFYFPVSTLINGYEYWFNDDRAGKTVVAVSNTTFLDLSSAISTSALSPGMNIFHIRFRDVSGSYSSTSSAYFVIMPEMLISGYEYWFDNDYASKTAVAVANTQMLDLTSVVTATSLSLGFHAFHIRFKNTTGTWCSTQSDLFYKHGTGNQNNLTSYEYWFDDNPAGKVSVSLANQPTADVISTISAASLLPGLHRVHVRFHSGDLPSVISSGYLYKGSTANVAENAITGYRFWFDETPSNMREIALSAPVSDMVILDSVDLPYLPLGKHLMSVEFRDTLGWNSSIVSDSVEVTNCHPYAARSITGNLQVCRGDGSVAYSIPPITNATGYVWSVPPGATIVSGSNTRSIVVSFALNAVSGNIAVYGANPCGTGVISVKAVTVNPLPVPSIAGDSVVCAGATGMVYTTQPGKSGYTWSVTPGGTVTSGWGTNSITVNWGSTAGAQTVTAGYLSAAGCYGSKSKSIAVKSLPPPNQTPANIAVTLNQVLCSDATDTLTAPEEGGWLIVREGGSAILIAGEVILLKPGARVYSQGYFHGYISSQCLFCNAVPHTIPQALKEDEIFATNTPVDPAPGTESGNYFRVFPNPTSGSFTLEILGNPAEAGTVEIYDMQGSRVMNQRLSGDLRNAFTLEGRPAGMYVIRVKGNGLSETARIVKQ